jgi:hypothetical protein
VIVYFQLSGVAFDTYGAFVVFVASSAARCSTFVQAAGFGPDMLTNINSLKKSACPFSTATGNSCYYSKG